MRRELVHGSLVSGASVSVVGSVVVVGRGCEDVGGRCEVVVGSVVLVGVGDGSDGVVVLVAVVVGSSAEVVVVRAVRVVDVVVSTADVIALGGGGSGGAGSGGYVEKLGREVAVGARVKSGAASCRSWDPATIAAVVANTVATTMPDEASTTRPFGRASGSSSAVGSIGVPLVGSVAEHGNSSGSPGCAASWATVTDSQQARLTAWVHGRVQGVGFRWWTRARALELGLVGSATNLPASRVEVVAEGPREACERLLAALRSDDTPGHVEHVAEQWSTPRGGLTGFVER